jgi:AcrR family transcriptional regulator
MLGACAEVIAEVGYDDLTVQGLTEAAGVSKATFYREFDGLGDCVRATYEMATESALAVTLEACRSAAEPAEALPGAVASLLDLLAAEPALAHVLTDGALDDVEGLYAARAEFVERCARLLSAAFPSAEGAAGSRSMFTHRVRATRGWLANRLFTGDLSGLPARGPELTQMLAG